MSHLVFQIENKDAQMIIQRKGLERIKEGANLSDFDGLFAFPLQCAHLRSFEGQEALPFHLPFLLILDGECLL